MAFGKEIFCNNYMLVDAGEAGFVDLLRLLLSPKYLDKKRFIKFSDDQQWHQDFTRRRLIFVSLLVQKLLTLLRKPMAVAGYMLEMWLNLVSINGGPFMLLLNLFTGKLQWPDRSSAAFSSVVGNTDRRIELDASIGRGDARYIPSLAIMAAKLSYESENHVKTVIQHHWMMEFLGFYNFWNDYQQRLSTPVFIAKDRESEPTLVVIAFRGTDPFDADGWSTDVDISWYELENIGKVHAGFMKALGLQKDQGWPKNIQQPTHLPPVAYYTIKQLLKRILQDNDKVKFIVTGHSLGGALAILFVAILMLHEEELLLERLHGVYTFGQPRVGDKKFGEFMEEKLRKYEVNYCRYVYSNDLVPRLPYDDKTILFKHFGPSFFYDSCYNGKVTREEENKNYFSLLWAIPKRVNAVWEIFRGFIIPIAKGSDYKENWFLRAIRLIGLVIPGLPNHCPQDYVNATRLGSLSS